MIEIDGKLLTLELFTEKFLCDIGSCKGMCCVDGNSGAPLEEEEETALRAEFNNYRGYMTAQGIEAVKKQGFAVTDADGDLTTPLIDGMECAYSVDEDGTTLCAVEKAWKEGKCSFRKPISCHLYPIRVTKFNNGSYGLNYHRWNVCSAAKILGESRGVPVYAALKEPLCRCFGNEFYLELEQAAMHLKKEGII